MTTPNRRSSAGAQHAREPRSADILDALRVRWAGGGLSLVAATDPRVSPAVDVLNLGRSMWLLGVAGWWVLMPAATLRVTQDPRLTRVEWSPMNVVFEELTFCVGDGCVNRFADDGGWEGYCPECLALWDDHAAGQHDSPVDACRLCR